MMPPDVDSPLMPHGGYRNLRSYKVARAVYDATVVFCRRFYSDDRRARRFTMIELMIVVIIVAILAASAVPIYRSAIARAYDAEVLSALGVIRYAQRKHLTEFQSYADDLGDLDVKELDFHDMRYVRFDQLSLGAGSGGAAFTAVWEGAIEGYPYARVTLDEKGSVVRHE